MASKESGDALGKRPLIAWAKAALVTMGQWYFPFFLGCGTETRPFSWPTSERLSSVSGMTAS